MRIILIIPLILYTQIVFDNKGDLDFATYLNNYDLIELPIELSEGILEKVPLSDNKEIEQPFISHYLGSTESISENKQFYKYFYLFKFEINDKVGVVAKEVGSAGGIEDRYILIVYDKEGKVCSDLKIAEYLGDCGFLVKKTSTIKENFKVEIIEKNFKGDCENDEYELTQISTRNFIINPNTGILEEDKF